MDFTWDPSFKPFLRYSYLGFLPPFSQNLLMGFVATFGIGTSLVRGSLTFLQKGAFTEKVCNVSILIQQLLRGLIFLYKRKSLNAFAYEMNKFIKDHKHNPIIEKEDFFLNIWKKSDAFTYAKWYFISVMAVCVIWKIPILIHLSNNYESVNSPYYALVSPYFAYNSYTKWIYTIVDIHLDLFFLFNVIHTEMVLLVFLKFLYCQYSYLKQLLDEIYADNCAKPKDPKILKWWMETHCLVIRLTSRARVLLEPIIAVNYICQIVGVASCIVILIEDRSVQSLLQKFLLIALFAIILFQLGCHCNTVETINIVNSTMNENLNPYTEVDDKAKTDIVFNMINFSSRTPIKISGYGFFNYNNKEYKDLLFTTYSFYSTLMSFKKGG